ncbi:sialate O-acetylesterase [Limibacter armeniacum]|uniref:sialate O-acetylesterase n=1 Tax=Limibacter armeniacum TaxID=466084 RepID=UPI002FE62A63
MNHLKTLLCLLLLTFSFDLFANISLPSIFGHHMVLQQQETVNFWGWGKPGEEVHITCSWSPETDYKTIVSNLGKWNIDVSTPEAGGPFNIHIKGYNAIDIEDVLIGEVWLGSGQSNMEWTPALGIDNAEEEKVKANYPEIRFFNVLSSTADTPQQQLHGEWVKCTPESMYYFSALLYFFGRELHQQMNVPVGLINSSWGGTPVEVWIHESAIQNDRILAKNASLLQEMSWGPHQPGKAYNTMIHPLIPYKIKGALWYQGETNTANPHHYARTLKTLIETWRAEWGYDFPFYYAQIAPYRDYGNDNVNGAVVRDQQRKVMELVPNTGMVVTSDIGNLDNIHPGNKQDVGKRLATWALSKQYGKVGYAFSGPAYKAYELKQDKIILSFDYAESGLVAKGGDLKAFEIQGDDEKWYSASAKIKGNKVTVWSDKVSHPTAVRYGYSNDSDPKLFNESGLPASCFLFYINSPEL